MTRRSVSNDVGRFGKINIVENVGKMLKHQIVDDSAWLVDRPFLAGRRLMRWAYGAHDSNYGERRHVIALSP
jgi:hypothetical protein